MYAQDSAAIRKRPINPKFHATRLAHMPAVNELPAKINAPFAKTNSIPAWGKPAAYTALAIGATAVAALIFSKFNVNPWMRMESKLLTPSVISLGIPTTTALIPTAPIDFSSLSGQIGHEGIPSALPARGIPSFESNPVIGENSTSSGKSLSTKPVRQENDDKSPSLIPNTMPTFSNLNGFLNEIQFFPRK